MENTPLTPRPRRSDRRTAVPGAEQSAAPVQPYAPSPASAGSAGGTARQQTPAASPAQSAYDAREAYYRQRPAVAAMQQRMNGAVQPQQAQRPVQQPVQSAVQARASVQTRPSVQARPSVPERPVEPRPQAPAGNRTPRVLQQQSAAYSRWQMPESNADPLPASPAPQAAPETQKLPGWLTTALCVMLITVMALIAAIALMQGWLKRDADARQAAYEAVLRNYHVTEKADGTFRVTWQDEIERYAAQYNLQPAFVTAIIRNESSFRTNAESGVGARGLMQLMPDTAEWIAGKLDDDSYSFDRMYDAETNIRYGCWYLGYLNKLFRGDAVLVSAAYHAGQTQVTRWLSDSNLSPDGVSIPLENMTDGPTKQYAGRVTQAYGIYQSLLYPEQAFE